MSLVFSMSRSICLSLIFAMIGTKGTRMLYVLSFMHAFPPRLSIRISFLIGSLAQAAASADAISMTYPPFHRCMRALARRVGPLGSCKFVSAF